MQKKYDTKTIKNLDYKNNTCLYNIHSTKLWKVKRAKPFTSLLNPAL